MAGSSLTTTCRLSTAEISGASARARNSLVVWYRPCSSLSSSSFYKPAGAARSCPGGSGSSTAPSSSRARGGSRLLRAPAASRRPGDALRSLSLPGTLAGFFGPGPHKNRIRSLTQDHEQGLLTVKLDQLCEGIERAAAMHQATVGRGTAARQLSCGPLHEAADSVAHPELDFFSAATGHGQEDAADGPVWFHACITHGGSNSGGDRRGSRLLCTGQRRRKEVHPRRQHWCRKVFAGTSSERDISRSTEGGWLS